MLGIRRESRAEVLPEIIPLLYAHYEEIAHYKDIPLAPDWDRYEAAEKAGILRIYTVRAVQLVGYAIYLVAPHLHYTSMIRAAQDILYLSPDFRAGSIGRRLIAYSEQQLALEGVTVIEQHVKARPELDFSPLLERMGYECMDTVWVKRLDR